MRWAPLFAVLLLPGLLAAAPFGGRTPEQLCGLMEKEHFRTHSWREAGDGLWRCRTARKKLPQGEPAGASDVRYRVEGRDGRPGRLLLELRMESWRAPQGVLNRFSRMVETLLQGLGLEPPKGLAQAVRSAGEGEWLLPGYRLRLQKRFSRGTTYELWFQVESTSS